jgi:aldoxime dehydratase
MESAIPEHLRTSCPRARKIDGKVAQGFTPVFPAYAARYAPGVESVVMAYFGLQYVGGPPQDAEAALQWIIKKFAIEDGPAYWDRSKGVDSAGFTNIVFAAYWHDRLSFDRWFPSIRDIWTGEGGKDCEFGKFIEVLTPSAQGYETLFSSPHHAEGVAHLATSMSGEVLEHTYWGSMRDRIALSQSDDMQAAGEPHLIRDGKLVHVVPYDNLCLIRSGQDWSDTDDIERKMYLDDVEPVLREGMDFLRDSGVPIGCFSNRYLTVLSPDGGNSEKTFGMSIWRDLASLEAWAEHHPTHLKIFGAAMRHLTSLGPAVKLRLYHEVAVVTTGQQFFEYWNCHAKTGLLNINS